MKTLRAAWLCVPVIAGIVVSGSIGSIVPADEPATVTVSNKATSKTQHATIHQARSQAKILHTALHATLQVVHDRYYREDEGLPIPASIMADVFKELEDQQNIKLRWLAVEGLAMNTDHRPQNIFENEAAESLKSGKQFHEQSENGIYRRVAPITLSSHCLKCHVPDRKSTRNRVAGLIIAIPVQE